MKKHLSVLMLFTKITLPKGLAIIAATAAAECALFWLALSREPGYFGINTILGSAHPGLVSAAGFLVFCAFLCVTGCEFGAKSGFTLDRLRVSRKAVFVWQAAHNAGMLIIFWAAQTALALTLCGFYAARFSQPQAAVLAFYQNDFLHSLLPLADRSRLACGAAMLVSLAVTAACFPVKMRRGQKPYAAFAVAMLCVQSFSWELGSALRDFIFAAIVLLVAFFAADGVWKGDADETLS